LLNTYGNHAAIIPNPVVWFLKGKCVPFALLMELEALKSFHKLLEFFGQGCDEGHPKGGRCRDNEVSCSNLLVIMFLVSRRIPINFERDWVAPPNLQFSNYRNNSFDLLVLLQEEYQSILTILILVIDNGKIARDVLSLGVGR
jgi:hypothetical protein